MSHDFLRQRALRRLLVAAVLFFASLFAAAQLQADDGLPVAEVQHDGAVDFQREILPILRRNCIACHNTTNAESDLVLETPQTILEGGSEGAGVVPGNADESLIFLLAAHRRESFMPPEENDSGAKNLTPEELGLLKLWIDQGATGEVAAAAEPLRWQPLPPGLNSIYSAAVSSHGQFIAAARANQIFLYHLPARQELGRLTDPVLISSGLYQQPGVAHLDMVQSLAFSPDETRLASGGFRTVKIWQRPQNVREKELPAAEGETHSLSVSRDGRLAALGQADGKIVIYDCAEAKVLHTLAGHTSAVTATAFSADGSRLVSGSLDKTCRVWNVSESKQLAELATESEVTAVALVRNDEQLAVGSSDHTLRIWPVPPAESDAKPEVLKELSGHTGPITALAAVEGSRLVSASSDGTARLWDIESGQVVRQFEHKAPITALAVRAEQQRLATAADNGTTKLWNLEKEEPLAELTSPGAKPFEQEELALQVEIAKRYVQTYQTDLDNAVKLKEAEDKKTQEATEQLAKRDEEVKQKSEAAKKAAEKLAAGEKKLADAKTALAEAEKAKQAATEKQTAAATALTAATTERDAKNKALAEATAALEPALEAKKASDAALAEARQRQEAAQGGEDAAAIEAATADVNTATEKQAVADKAAQEAEAVKQKAMEAQASAEKALATAEAAKKEADTALAKATAAVEEQKGKVPAAEKEVTTLAAASKKAADEQSQSEQQRSDSQQILERAKQVAASATAEVARLEQELAGHKAAQTEAEERLAAHNKAAAERSPHRALAFSPDGSQLAVASDAAPVHIFRTENGALLESITDGENSPRALAYLADKRLLTIAQRPVVWQTLADWKLERTIGSFDSQAQLVDRVTALSFSPDGKLLATGGGEPSRSGELKLWDAATGELVREISPAHGDTILAVAFSPDGKHIATGGADREVKVFDVTTGEQVKLYEGHTHHVLGVSWRADGRVLVSSGADLTLKVWDFVSGEQLRTITGFDRQATSVQFLGASDEFVISASRGQAVVKNSAGGNGQLRIAATDGALYITQATRNGQTVVAGGEASIVHVWNEKGEKVIDFAPPAPQTADNTSSASK